VWYGVWRGVWCGGVWYGVCEVWCVVVCGVVVWSPKTKIISGGKRRLFSFLLLEYDFCLLNWIRVDSAPQIQINK
jgi:hypothetical protein